MEIVLSLLLPNSLRLSHSLWYATSALAITTTVGTISDLKCDVLAALNMAASPKVTLLFVEFQNICDILQKM